MSRNDTHIQFRSITKVYPGSIALKDVGFSIRRGEVHALLGENGAGKSTLLNILHGVTSASSGTVYIQDEPVFFTNAAEAIERGIVKVHQEINLVTEQTVAQNIMLGRELRRGIFLDYKAMNRETEAILRRLRCTFHADTKVSTLSTGEMQMLQIAKALHVGAQIISLDEPTASLSRRETEVLFDIIRELKQNGITIIYISHRLEEVFQIADRATVLRDGQYISTDEIEHLSKADLIKKMVGRDVSGFARRLNPPCVDTSRKVLEVRNLSLQSVFRNISFTLYKGEILGFFGLVGSKRTDVMRSIFGADPRSEGEVLINGRPVENRRPSESVANGIGLISEDRKAHGFIKDLDNSQNITIRSLKRYMRFGFIDHAKRIRHAVEIGRKINLVPTDPHFRTVNLSGGNQQKVVLAKWLATDVDIFIFDEPTKGIDVGAKAEIYKLMEALVKNGKSLIMISSELPEVIGMSDRMLIMHEGSLAAEFPKSEFSEERILTEALGGR